MIPIHISLGYLIAILSFAFIFMPVSIGLFGYVLQQLKKEKDKKNFIVYFFLYNILLIIVFVLTTDAILNK